MATWGELHNYITSNYKVTEENESRVHMLWEAGEGRSQAVMVFNNGEVEGNFWATIGTVIAEESQIDHMDLLRRNSNMICGGIGLLQDGTVIFQYSIRLNDLDVGEFEDPLHIVIHCGDDLERQLTGQDVY